MEKSHSDILMMGMGGGGGGRGGGPTEAHILYPKNPNFRICLPKKVPTILAFPKNYTSTLNYAFVTVDLS